MSQAFLAALFQRTLLLLIPQECYDTLFVRQEFFDVPCLKLAASKGLGLAIVAGSVLVKVPQILKILSSKSAKGISILGVFFDLFAVTSVVAYSYVKQFPFSAWGDSLFLLIQTLIIVLLVLYYSVSKSLTISFAVAFFPTLYALLNGGVPFQAIWTLQALSIPFMFTSKLVQAYTNYKAKGTGQLSHTTFIMLFVGSVIRVFTSVQETGDFTVILMYVLASLANFIIVAQFYVYKKKPSKKNAAKKKAKSKSK
ncbi:unnamed protein product [Bemisia tabaci]|uniref:Mannose-P-dolichol utilization defect 1 protein homolog n=1 Tax=Bemisia tabaci TaxID=7038 RepID=A0A9P0F8N0_BEMTA|nr:PREDICTED: mannose-P-dolichol utilization defect 1 protein homolog [Bemisia tabaci]CAH0394363.1 unnamed protein product [Bemisia tabaci]